MSQIGLHVIQYNGISQIMSRTNRKRKFKRANVPGSKYAWVRKFQGAKIAPGNESSRSEKTREHKGQGVKANWPRSYWPIRFRERIGPGAKRLWIKFGCHIHNGT